MPLTEQQIKLRKQGIGGSDAGAVLGLNPWWTPLQVYMEKVGELEPEDLSDNDAVRWGVLLESAIADEYALRKNVKIRRVKITQKHPKYPWMLAHLDRRIVGQRKLVEIKTTGFWLAKEWGPDGSDQVPESTFAQVLHYLAVTGYDSADLVVLIGGRDLRVYTFERDEAMIANLIEVERRFWEDHVLKLCPPDPSNLSDVALRWPRDCEEAIEAEPDIVAAVQALHDSKARIKDEHAVAESLEVKIKDYMADAGRLESSGDKLATWISQWSKRVDLKALAKDHPALADKYRKTTESRVFRLTQNGGRDD